jgi:hypothetical protein
MDILCVHEDILPTEHGLTTMELGLLAQYLQPRHVPALDIH